METVVTFDTETTGLGSSARLVELAAIRWTDGVEVDRFHSLINPGIPIPPEASAIHGITDEMVAGAPSAAEVMPRFVAFVGGDTLVAHNAQFDDRMVRLELHIAGLARLRNPLVCTVRMAKGALATPNHKLQTVADALGVPPADAHRAMADALRCGGSYWAMRRMGVRA